MDIYLKALGGALLALLVCLVLSGTGKDFSMLLGLLTCCMITTVAMAYLDPVMAFLEQLEAMIPLDNSMLRILIKIMGIGIIGEVASLICSDSGSSALGKSLQLITGMMILWMALPLMQMLLDLIGEIMEGV